MSFPDHVGLSGPDLPPFRAIAIVDGPDRIRRACDFARSMRGLHLGLMLRDPEHRPGRVVRLAEILAGEDVPDNIVPIANGVPIDGMFLHLPTRSFPSGVPNGRSFGVSAHDVEEAIAAENAGASYITVSPVFPTASKPGHPGLALDGLERICSAVRIPVFALGGLVPADIGACLRAGAYGVAGISLFDPIDRSRLLDELFQHFNP